MSWTSGTWGDVAIGDTVLGGDGYPWSVNYAVPDPYESGRVKIVMERDGREAVTGSIPDSKPVKYRKAEPAPSFVAEMTTEARCPECGTPISRQYEKCIDCERYPGWHTGRESPKQADDPSSFEQEEAPTAAPYVEYSEAERVAAANLKAAGFTMEVIERVMTLDGLTEHISNVHGHDVPGQDKLRGTADRAKLADLHFDLHLQGQERNRKWEPRGRTPHVHPVMDRPMDAG